MRQHWWVIAAAFVGASCLTACAGSWSDLRGGAGVHDIDDVTGYETNDSVQVDVAEDTAEAGLRLDDRGHISAPGIDLEPEELEEGVELSVPDVAVGETVETDPTEVPAKPEEMPNIPIDEEEVGPR